MREIKGKQEPRLLGKKGEGGRATKRREKGVCESVERGTGREGRQPLRDNLKEHKNRDCGRNGKEGEATIRAVKIVP